MTAVVCKGLVKTFRQGDEVIYGLDHVDLSIKEAGFVCLSGPSGSGKTTLLNAIGGLDKPDAGSITIAGQCIDQFTKSEMADMRLNNIGFVFQAYNLVPVLTARENVEFVMQVQGIDAGERRAEAMAILKEVGLEGMENRRPAELSGGQQQRVAVARAIVSKPALVLADEPTANLDSKTAEHLMNLFVKLNQHHKVTFIIATHDQRVMDYARRLIRMVDGKIVKTMSVLRALVRALVNVFSAGLVIQAAPAMAEAPLDFRFNGHLKGQLTHQQLPDNSLFRDVLGAQAQDQGLDLRLKFSAGKGAWTVEADYQLIAIAGDSQKLSRSSLATPFPTERFPTDERRLWDLTHVFSEQDHHASLHRLDRLSLDYRSENTVLKLGRQVVSWGNGLIYNPMDIFNPFDPAAVDKEYKTGDDMLYGQQLFASGNDLQGVWVVRRDEVSGDVESDVASMAVKYHGFASNWEYDLLLAEHYDDLVVAAGASRDVGGAVWRGDVTVADTEGDTVYSAVTSLSYSWVQWGKNVSGVLEYYYNGFGETGGDYRPEDLAQNTALLERLSRGELYTLGRHYIAASASIEMTPLLLLTPNLFLNPADPSALFQLVAQYDRWQNLQLLGAINLPVGPEGSEYGGIESSVPGRYLSVDLSAFVQLAWYF